MRPIPVVALFATLLLAGCASTQATRESRTFELPAQGSRVQVSWLDPQGYLEASCRFNSAERGGEWMEQLAEYTRRQADKRLPSGEQLSVRFIDVDRAGECEPGRTVGQPIRIVREIYPPRIELEYTLSGSGRAVPAQGRATLHDLGFMVNSGGLFDNDALRYEKRAIHDWLRRLGGAR